MQWKYFLFSSLMLSTLQKVHGQCTSNLEPLFEKYDKNHLPTSTAINVTVELHINEIYGIDDSTSDLNLNLNINEVWHDPNLDFTYLYTCLPSYILKPDHSKRIWTPKVIAVNSKPSEIETSHDEHGLITLHQNGLVWASYKMKAFIPCKFNWSMFPFDQQVCTLSFESSHYGSDQVELIWNLAPMTVMPQIRILHYDIQNFSTSRIQHNYPQGLRDELIVTLKFNRPYFFYLIFVYFPSTLMIILSWIGFFMGAASVPVRVSLSVSALIGLAFPLAIVLKYSPAVSTLTCLNIWMVSCLTFIMLAAIATAIACHLSKRQKKPKTVFNFAKSDPHLELSGTSMKQYVPGSRTDLRQSQTLLNSSVTSYEVTRCPKTNKLPSSSVGFDIVCMVLFPFAFIVFNVIYWCAYFLFY